MAKRATRAEKAKFENRIKRKNERLQRKGKSPKCYYTTSKSQSGKKTFSGGKDLQLTAAYPQRFCTALFRAWLHERAEQAKLIEID